MNSSPLACRILYPPISPKAVPLLFRPPLPVSGCTTPADETRAGASRAVGGLFALRLPIDVRCGAPVSWGQRGASAALLAAVGWGRGV